MGASKNEASLEKSRMHNWFVGSYKMAEGEGFELSVQIAGQ